MWYLQVRCQHEYLQLQLIDVELHCAVKFQNIYPLATYVGINFAVLSSKWAYVNSKYMFKSLQEMLNGKENQFMKRMLSKHVENCKHQIHSTQSMYGQ